MTTEPHLERDNGVGWTKAEYDACPELADRLHRRILDLEDCLERLTDTLGDVRVSGLAGRTAALHDAWTRGRELLR